MSELDKKILEAMKKGTSELHDSPEETYAPGLIRQSFKGAFRVTFIVLFVVTLAFVALAAWCTYSMFSTDLLDQKIHWLTGVMASFMVLVILRLWFFMELNRLSVIREIKRVELQLAVIASKLEA